MLKEETADESQAAQTDNSEAITDKDNEGVDGIILSAPSFCLIISR